MRLKNSGVLSLCYNLSQTLYFIYITMKTADFDYNLPQQLIAQQPIEPRDSSRLMLLDRQNGTIEHSVLSSIGEYLKAGDVLVFNDSRVIPARLKGNKADTGGKVEILLLRHTENGSWGSAGQAGQAYRHRRKDRNQAGRRQRDGGGYRGGRRRHQDGQLL